MEHRAHFLILYYPSLGRVAGSAYTVHLAFLALLVPPLTPLYLKSPVGQTGSGEIPPALILSVRQHSNQSRLPGFIESQTKLPLPLGIETGTSGGSSSPAARGGARAAAAWAWRPAPRRPSPTNVRVRVRVHRVRVTLTLTLTLILTTP